MSPLVTHCLEMSWTNHSMHADGTSLSWFSRVCSTATVPGTGPGDVRAANPATARLGSHPLPPTMMECPHTARLPH